ncbi:hypothetical protein OEZ86_008420 [Tetradesmus obliquus]|nr:hypothetical protein OEZ86_008420 [Tetradesmus obliquus]
MAVRAALWCRWATAVADLAEARGMAAAAAGASSAAALFGEVDYLVGCHWDSSSGQLLLVAGTNGGAAAFFPIAEQQHRAGQIPPGGNLLQQPAVVLNGCHRDVVRSVDCFAGTAEQRLLCVSAAQRLLCVSAGEDAQLALWTLDQAAVAAAAVPSISEDSARPSRRQEQHAHNGNLRRSPY